ncbi:MAG: O-antigen ligase family protein [Hyphomicrobiaceae bacterium]
MAAPQTVTGVLSLPRVSLLRWLAAAALVSSSVVFSEPAPVDVLLAGFTVALLVLGCGRPGWVAGAGVGLWLIVAGFGLAGTAMSPDVGDAARFQLVTLYLALATFALAAFIAEDPERHFHLVAMAYLAGALIAALAGLAGYFKLIPGAYELFTNYGRARGSFKDPNVFGAALAPAFCYVAWIVLREPRRLGVAALPVLGVLAIAILLSFSRGAWISVAASLGLMLLVLVASARRRGDRNRLMVMSLAGAGAVAVAVVLAMQIDSVRGLLTERASLTQSYDVGPEGRFGGQAKALALLVDSPLGIGTHTFRTHHHHEEVHNVYLTTFMNAGWPGGFAYIAVVALTLGIGLARLVTYSRLQGPLIVATAAFLGLIIEGFIIDTDHWRHFFIVTAMIWGLADARVPEVDAGQRAGD